MKSWNKVRKRKHDEKITNKTRKEHKNEREKGLWDRKKENERGENEKIGMREKVRKKHVMFKKEKKRLSLTQRQKEKNGETEVVRR